MTDILQHQKSPTYWGDDLLPRNCKCHGAWVGSCICYKRWMATHMDLRAIEIRSLQMKEREKITGKIVQIHY